MTPFLGDSYDMVVPSGVCCFDGRGGALVYGGNARLRLWKRIGGIVGRPVNSVNRWRKYAATDEWPFRTT